MDLQGYFRDDYEDLVFCSPGCMLAVMRSKENSHVAEELERAAIRMLADRFPQHSFARVGRWTRYGMSAASFLYGEGEEQARDRARGTGDRVKKFRIAIQ